MAKSHKSATLPPNFLHQAQPPAEENEGFFSKLKKRFKLKKGRYHVDVNTGDCENVSAVSFKKRESAELVDQDQESPLKYMLGRASERATRSASPKASKPASRTSSERIASSKKPQIVNINIDKEIEHDSSKSGSKKSRNIKEGQKGNEYSSMNFDREDPGLVKPVQLDNEDKVNNECLMNDDSAIDLDGYDVDSNYDFKKPSHKVSSQTADPCITNSSHSIKKDVDKLDEPGYASVNDVKEPGSDLPVKTSKSTEFELDFDPNYESVKDVKAKIRNQGFDERISKSMESLDDPNYQSINDVKRKKEELFGSNTPKPRKTYSMFESIESLDEPGYESLNDVKKRIAEQKLSLSTNTSEVTSEDSSLETNKEATTTTAGVDLDDSAVGMSVVTDSLAGDETDSVRYSADLTDSSKSKDSGFDSKTSPSRESTENLYSKVRKRSEEPPDIVTTAAKKPSDNTDKKKSEVKASKESVEVKVTTKVSEVKVTAERSEVKVVQGEEEFDSDVELSLDPGYAECADAIKGFPISVYSDGSGSKMSSCNSLDISAEDFPSEPGYAECADAIKTGVIKKISVSNERLVDATKVKRYSVDEATLRKGVSADIYANPQILFRKRSKLIDDRNSGEFTGSSESLMSNASAKSKEVEIKKEEAPIFEAPPLPARNYSLYLDNEEADKLVPADTLDQSGERIPEEDDAFEEKTIEEKAHLEKEFEENGHSEKEVEEKGDCEKEKIVTQVSLSQSELSLKKRHSGETKLEVDTKINVETILQMESDLKDELRYEPMLKTPDDVDEVTKSIESKFPDTFKLPTDELDGGFEDVELCKICDEETISYQADEQCNSSEFIVKVPDKSGGTKILKICEKKESQHILEKRKSVRQTCGSENNCEVDDDSKKGSKSSTNCDVKTCDITTKESDNTNDSEAESFQQTDAIETCSENKNVSTGTGQELNAYHVTCDNQPPSETESRSIDDDIPIKASKSVTKEADCRTRLKDETNKMNLTSTTYSTGTPHSQSNKLPSNTSIATQRHKSQVEAAPKFMSVSSFDSDEEFVATEQLPKLEIVEGEWENVFEKNTGFDTSEEKVNSDSSEEEKGLSHDAQKSDKGESDKCELKDEVDGCSTDNDTNKVEKHGESSQVDIGYYCIDDVSVSGASKRATLDTQLCVVVPGGSIPDKAVSDMNTSEDRSEQILVCDENKNTVSTDTSEGSELSPQTTSPGFCDLSSYSDMIPNLYNDTEPTHMSLREIMTLSGSDISATHLSSSNAGNSKEYGSSSSNPRYDSASSTANSNTIPHWSLDIPPPRPPTSSAQRSSKHTPTDEVPPPYRPAANEDEQAGCSGESPPPAIPPRAKIRKQPRPGENLRPAIPSRAKIRKQPRPVSDSQDFMESMRQLKDCGWYWGPLSWEEAEQKLANKPEGTFLVRDSSDERYILSLSFKNQGRVHHTRIEHHKGHFSFWSQPDSHGKSTIKEFIEQCVNNSRNGRFLYFIRPSGPGSPPMPIHLLHPVSRFVQMRSLQHMCRFRILQMVRRDHIDDLPVPTRIKLYLKEAQYYVEYLDD